MCPKFMASHFLKLLFHVQLATVGWDISAKKKKWPPLVCGFTFFFNYYLTPSEQPLGGISHQKFLTAFTFFLYYLIYNQQQFLPQL